MKYFTHQYRLIILCSAILAFFYNNPLYEKLIEAFPPATGHSTFVMACAFLLFCATAFIFCLFAGKYITRPLLMLSFISAAAGYHFMSAYGTVIDSTMWLNMLQTDMNEVSGLMNISFLLHVGIMGILPALVLWKWKINYNPIRQELAAKIIVLVVLLCSTALTLLAFSGNFASLFREHKPVRYYANPIYGYYSGGKLLADTLKRHNHPITLELVSNDAKIVEIEDHESISVPERELVVLIVGESARADHFQLNGYERETTPELSKMDNLVSFSNMWSCGTSTAISVPCMFLQSGQNDYYNKQIYEYENALDVLKREGVNVLWRDNNSSSKGVADRVEYQNFRSTEHNTLCDDECRDEGMLVGLQDYINQHTEGDILIVLHQMGSHGPEYYKRYPAKFEHFSPVCTSGNLGDCPNEGVVNAYDNTIRYTDHVISEAIKLLKNNDDNFEANLLYISDHGESLGENHVHLHGLPYMFAPDAQKHVGAIMWMGKYSDISVEHLKQNADKRYTQDTVYCALLNMFESVTADCQTKETFLDNAMGTGH
jgi:lipid A ethanolaminephosphotransferase